MKAHIQVLTAPTVDTPGTTLLLHFDDNRYLIGNLSEGTQRACVQMGAKLLKVQTGFITGRTEWRNIGGLIGMILTLADGAASSNSSVLADLLSKVRRKARADGYADDKEKMRLLEDEAREKAKGAPLTLFGPPNLNYALATARRFVFRKGMPVDVREVGCGIADVPQDENEVWAPHWADSNIKVWALSVSPNSSVSSSRSSSASRPGTAHSLNTRKRRIDELYGPRAPVQIVDGGELSQREQVMLESKSVVADMFNSTWRLDTLYETPLSEVKLPATIFVRDTEKHRLEVYKGPLPGSGVELPDPEMKVLVRRPWPGALVSNLPRTEPIPDAISYIIRAHKQRGKFLPAVAQKLKVQHGRDYSRLAQGHSVINEDGETITSEMVMEPSREGSGIAVIELPDSSYIDGLLNRPEWREPSIMAGVGAMFWICGKRVATDARIHEFIQGFGEVEHIISSTDYCPNSIALDSVAATTVRMKRIDSARFNAPVHDSTIPDKPLPASKNVHIAKRGQTIHLTPAFKFDDSQVVPDISLAKVEQEVSDNVIKEAAKAHTAIADDKEQSERWAASILDKDAEIIALGTGSSLPSKYRNVSGTLVRVPGWGSMLFDAGESTINQLRRVLPQQELLEVLRSLKVIFISHLHADHHLGIASVIRAWYEAVHERQPAPHSSPEATIDSRFIGQNRLAVIAEPAMLHWLAEYSQVEDFGYSRIAPLHISCAQLQTNTPSQLSWAISPSESAELVTEDDLSRRLGHLNVSPSLLGFKDIQAVYVNHCHGARAFSATLPSGFKASFSGDCRPSKAFAKIGLGSTVCIHEATFDDEMQGDAIAKKHSTMSEALSVAQAMRAKTCVLTHFSQRYQKLPVLEYAENGVDKSVLDGSGIAVPESEGEDAVEDAIDAQADPSAYTNFHAGESELEPTLPDQSASGAEGKQYDLPSATASNGERGQSYKSLSSKKGALDPEAKQSYIPFSSTGEVTTEPSNTSREATSGSASTSAAAVRIKLNSDLKVCVAFDYMRIKVGEIGQQAKFTSALLMLFAEEEAKERKRKDGITAGLEKAKAEKKQKQQKNTSGGGGDGGEKKGKKP